MSRCFPFTRSSGFAGKCSSNEALILSIKLQRENEKANSDRDIKKVKSSDRKERKREKKEKKRQKEERGHYAVDSVKQKLIEKLYQADEFKVQPKGKSSLQGNETELLEKSSLTEEHGRPLDSQNVSCSSDSTGNSGKRKRHSSSPSGIQSNGNVIRIQLSSSHKTDGPSTSGRKEQEYHLPSHKRENTSYSKVQPCSNLLGTESSANQKDILVEAPQHNSNYASTSRATFQLASVQDKEKPGLPSKTLESVPPKEKLSSHERKMLKKESLYKNLFETWVPPVLGCDLVNEDDDEDWLFGKKGEERAAQRLKVSDHESSGDCVKRCASAVMQPRAQFLPEVDIYALPFTVPF